MKSKAAVTSIFPALCRAHGIPEPVPEYRFAPPRRWRLDWFWVDSKLGLECQGGLFTGGRHVRGAALLKEHEKLCEAAIRGIRVLFCQPADIQSGAIFPVIKRALSDNLPP